MLFRPPNISFLLLTIEELQICKICQGHSISPNIIDLFATKTKVNRLDKLVEKMRKKLARDVIKELSVLRLYFLRSRYAQIFDIEVHTRKNCVAQHL